MDAPKQHSNEPDPEVSYAFWHEYKKLDSAIATVKLNAKQRVDDIKAEQVSLIDEFASKGLIRRDMRDAIKILNHTAKIEVIRKSRSNENEDEVKQLDLFLSAIQRGQEAHEANAGEAMAEAAE